MVKWRAILPEMEKSCFASIRPFIQLGGGGGKMEGYFT